MSAKITPANVVQFLLSSCMVRLGTEGQLINRDDMAMSDEEISLRLLEYGGIHISHPLRMELIREAARVVHDLKMLRWEELYRRGEIDEAHPSPVRFKRTFDAGDREKLRRLASWQLWLGYALRSLRFDDYKAEMQSSLKRCRSERRHWRMFMKVEQK